MSGVDFGEGAVFRAGVASIARRAQAPRLSERRDGWCCSPRRGVRGGTDNNCHDGYIFTICAPSVNRHAGYNQDMSGARDTNSLLVTPFEEDLCLAFANTRYWRGCAQPTETIPDAAALTAWCARAGGWSWRDARALSARGGEDLLERGLKCRESLHAMFLALALGQAVPVPVLAWFHQWSREVPLRRAPVMAGKACCWPVAEGHDVLATLLAPVQWSAADLLARAGMRRIRACGNPACLWLFVDRSKSGTRRWCDMGACGNRAKAKRHYEKMRPSRAEGGPGHAE